MKNLIKIFSTVLLVTASIGLTSCVGSDKNRNDDNKNTGNIDLPAEENDYIVKIVPGENAVIDLNGDGENETINYGLKSKDINGNSYYVVNNLTISGVEYANENSDNPLEELGANIYYPDDQWYFIVDIDNSDDYREVAIADLGPSEDLTTSFFRYDGKELKYIGFISGFPTDDNYSMDGKGTIHSEGRLSLLQYWTAVFTWKLGDDGNLVSVEEDLYSPITYDEEDKDPVLLKEEITIYTEMDLSSKQILMEPSEEPVTFPLTDNKNWVLMHREDGTEGWIYIEDSMYIISDGKKLNCADVFENLFIAD